MVSGDSTPCWSNRSRLSVPCSRHPWMRHFGTAAQQSLFSEQQFRPLWKLPSFVLATQQALCGSQQASLSEQQFFACSLATTAPTNTNLKPSNEPAIKLVDVEIFQ